MKPSHVIFLSKGKAVRITNDEDHGFSGIEFDLITVIVEVLGRPKISNLLPGHVNSLSFREKPAVMRDVMALHGEIAIADLFLLDALYDHVAEGKLFVGITVHVRTVRASGNVLRTIVEMIVGMIVEIAPCQRIGSRHVDIACFLGIFAILGQHVWRVFIRKQEMIFLRQPSVFQAILLFLHRCYGCSRRSERQKEDRRHHV